MRRVLSSGLLLLALLAPGERLAAKEIDAEVLGKQPPAGLPGGGIQVRIRNITRETLYLRVRKPGSHWVPLEFLPEAHLAVKCETCLGSLDGALSEAGPATLTLVPGTEYEILREAGGEVQVRPASRR